MNEQINTEIMEMIDNGEHYLANSIFLPELIGKKYLKSEFENEFSASVIQVQRAYNVNDINQYIYENIKSECNEILIDLERVEFKHKSYLESLIVKIIKNKFDIYDEIQFNINLNSEVVQFEGEFGEEGDKDTQLDAVFKSYDEINSKRNELHKKQFIYALNTGISSEFMKNVYLFEHLLDKLDPKLFDYYYKILTFSDFNIWVTPDDVLVKENSEGESFKIEKNEGNVPIINVNSNNFIFALADTCKAVLMLLSNEKSENINIDYESIWNLRVGKVLYNDFEKHINRDELCYILKDYYNIPIEHFDRLTKEVLSKTQLAERVFKNFKKK